MENEFSWDFSLANYSEVWSFMVQIGLLFLFLMLGNTLRRKIPWFRKCLIPSALLGGVTLLIVNSVLGTFGLDLVNKHVMQVITYHCLAIGFAAMSLKTEKKKIEANPTQVFEFGAAQGGTYMIQAFVGLGITIVLFLLTQGEKVVSYISGLILPLAFGQGPGNALSWDVNYTNMPDNAFFGYGSFGLSLASIGFVVASVLGIVYINIHKKRGLKIRDGVRREELSAIYEESVNEIPDNESVDKFSLQIGFVFIAYAISFGFMCLLGVISDFTNSIAWGFNFLWASLAAMLVKAFVKVLRKTKMMKREYINNYQMDRISGLFFDLMIVAGVTAIEINDVKNYIIPIVILSVVGAAITWAYLRLVAKECFPGFEHEFFLMCFGTFTGTASNGMILMKQVDPALRTPTSGLYILSNFPAMVMIAPLLFLLGFAGRSFTNAIIACAIFFALWVLYTAFLFRRKIFKRAYKNKPVKVWQEEKQE